MERYKKLLEEKVNSIFGSYIDGLDNYTDIQIKFLEHKLHEEIPKEMTFDSYFKALKVQLRYIKNTGCANIEEYKEFVKHAYVGDGEIDINQYRYLIENTTGIFVNI